MKKLLAVLISIIMVLSLAVIPAYATGIDETVSDASGSTTDLRTGAEDVYEKAVSGDYFGALEGVFALVEDFANTIHNLVGDIMSIIGKECALCGALHG